MSEVSSEESATGIKGTEMNRESHTHDQMDVDILRRMKPEPSYYSQAQKPPCHSFEKQITENTFVQNYGEHITEDEYGSKGAANSNHDSNADVLASDEYIYNDEEGMVDQIVVTQKNPDKEIVPGNEEAEPDHHRYRRRSPYMRNSPRWTYNGIRSVLHRTSPSVSLPPDSPIVNRTRLLMNDSSDIFTQRLWKILKVLVSKRTFSLQQKIMNLEQRNTILEDTARNLKTTLTHLVREVGMLQKEKKNTKTMSRSTQVSLGMIISQAKSHCVEKPESLPVSERTPYHNFSDGPVIVNVFGNLHVPFGEALSVVESGNATPKSFEFPVLRLPHADVSYPKVQHVYSLNSSTPESLNKELLTPGGENYVLPEHGLFDMPRTQAIHESMTRTNEQRPETCYFLRNVSSLTASQQGHPGDEDSHLLHNGVETAYSIAPVHPQGIVSSQDITSSKHVQRKTQATQYPQEKWATSDFGPLLHDPTQSLASKQRDSEGSPLQSQFLVYAPQQGKNFSSDTITSSSCLKAVLQDSWKDMLSTRGTVSVQPLKQPIRQDAHAAVVTDRIASGSNPDFSQCFQNEGNFVSLVGHDQERITVNNVPVLGTANDTRLSSSASLYSLSQHQGFPFTQLPRVFRQFEVSDKGIVALNPETQTNLNDFSTHVNSSSSFPHSRSSITVPTQEVEAEQPFENRRDIVSSVLELNHAETHTSSTQGKTLTSRQDSEHEREKTKWVIDKDGAFSIDVHQQTRAREQQLYVSGNEQMPFQASDDSRSSDYCQIDNRHQQANLLVQQQQRPYEEGQPQPLLQQNQEQLFSLQQLKQRQWQQNLKQLRQKWQLQQRQHQQPQQESEQWHQQQQGNQQALSLQQLQQRQHQQAQLLSEQWPKQQEKQHILSLQQLEQHQWHLRLKQRRHQQKDLQQRQQQQPQPQSQQRHQQQQQQEKQHVLSLQQLEQQQWQQRLRQRRQQHRHLQQRQPQQLEQQEQQFHVLQHQQQQPEKQQLQQHHLLFQHQPFHQHPQTQSQIEQSQPDQEQPLQKPDHRQQLEKRLYQLPHRQQQQPNHESQIQALLNRGQLSSLIERQQQANWLPSRSELNYVFPEGMQNPLVSTPLSASQCAASIRGQSDNSQNV
ncbi:uncharacterized protein LOC114959018 isoform X3 [Acropora millepora]|nr:uncharacterized protein LOC114959018 isoform X3 [Acropora millepora]XP_044175131.1 uncharacterized protein LOC114959018 isoform X3 [Acropora millepora]